MLLANLHQRIRIRRNTHAVILVLLVSLAVAACSEPSPSRSPGPMLPRVGQPLHTPPPSAVPIEPGIPASPAVVPPPWSPPPVSSGAPAPSVSAVSALVLDEASATVLFAKNADRRLPPASLTKIATAVLALEQGFLDEMVTVDVDSRQMRSSTRMGLLPGDRFSLRDLLYGTMLTSGNDAALAVGRHLAGSDAAFVADMNALAERLDLRETHFVNAHGLSAREHLSSAYDLALLARYAMSIPDFATMASAPAWTSAGSRSIRLSNINAFLTAYSGADGVKTGYTYRAGRTMVASATREGHRVYVVLLNAPALDEDARAMLDWAFATFRWRPV